MKGLSKLLPALTFVLSLAIGYGQSITPEVPETRVFGPDNGLERNYVNDIVRDQQGYIWLATERGLVRFDGSNFVAVSLIDSNWGNRPIRKIRQTGNNLFLLFEHAGVLLFSLEDYSTKIIFPLEILDLIFLTESDWIQMDISGWLKRVVHGKARDSVRVDLRPEADVLLFLWQSKLLLHRGGKGMYAINPNQLNDSTNLGLSWAVSQMNFEQLDASRLLFVSDGRCMLINDALRVSEAPEGLELNSRKVKEYRQASPELSYYAVHQRLFRTQKGITQEVPIRGLSNAEMRKIFIADSVNVLVGTNMGLVHLRAQLMPVEHWEPTVVGDLSNLFVHRRVINLDDGDLAFFGTPGLMIRNRSGNWRVVSQVPSDAFDAVRLGDKVLVTSHGNGVGQMDVRSQQYARFIPPPRAADSAFFGISEGRSPDEVLVGRRGSYVSYSIGSRKEEIHPIPNPAAAVREFYYDAARHRYWIGTDSGLCYTGNSGPNAIAFRHGQAGLRGKQISGLIPGAGDLLWVSHDKGLQAIDLNSLKVVQDLPPDQFINPRVAAMLVDAHGRLWMSTYSGVVAFDPVGKGIVRLDGTQLMNDEFNYKSAAVLPDRRLIFGGLKGYDVIDPERFSFSAANGIGRISGYEHVTIASRIFEKVDEKNPVISFNTQDESIRIHLSSTDAMQTDTYRYEYSLNEGAWISLPGGPIIDVYTLEPGRYTLKVRATDRLGSLITFPETTIQALVPFYREKAFLWLLMFLLILALITIGLVTRSSWRKERALKEQISMDLHDEIGTILTRALLVASSEQKPQRQVHLKQYLSEALFSLRAYVNTMHRGQFRFQELTVDLNELVNTVLEPLDYQYTCNVSHDRDLLVPGELYRDVKLCLYEALNNIIKHAKANRVRVEVKGHGRNMYVSVEDNGTFNEAAIRSNKGNGLSNLRKRVRKYGGEIAFSRSEEGGLKVVFNFPNLQFV